ncbi:MAG: DUF1236 domain-containing protein [Pararhodobacter sp.]|nr:DUF1236 domain-containing protein [Pararhodobacter sp.]
MNAKMIAGGALAASLLASTALAETSATATTDLNLRAGPGPIHEIRSVIPKGASVTVLGCLEAANWCEVGHDGIDGWAYGDYLEAEFEAEPVALSAPEVRSEIRVVEHEDAGANVIGGATMGAIAGAILAGPFGAAVGAAAGAGAGGLAPRTTTVTYVRENPVEPVFLDGEVVVGAGLPEDVMLEPVPESNFRYAYINGVPVIVDPDERRIVYIVR